MKLYLATPFSHKDRHVMLERFNVVNKVAAKLMANGYIVYSPISHTHPISEAGSLPTDWEFWKEQDSPFLEWCDELWVLVVNGWRDSVGVQAEIEEARELNKPVRFIGPDSMVYLGIDV